MTQDFGQKNKNIASFKTYEKWINNKKIINGGVGLKKDQSYIFLLVGPHIIQKQKIVLSGMNMEKNI